MKQTSGPKIKCITCGDIIQSKHRHDFVWCSCKDRQEMQFEKFIADCKDFLGEDFSTPAFPNEADLRKLLNTRSTAVAVDGGADYLKMCAGPNAVWEMWK